MCVILDIQPGVIVPEDKLARACDINKHGYGIAYVDKNEIKVRRSLKDNNPKEIQKSLESLSKFRVFVHLRHATVGPVSMINNHPMVVLKRNRRAIMLMHNGTLGDYTPKADDKLHSDTFCFNRDWVMPLTQRVESFSGIKNVLRDPIFQKTIGKEAGYMSVLVLFDSWGNVLRVNENKGQQYDGWWASNSYSFNDNHTRSSVSSYGAYGGYSQHAGQSWWEKNRDRYPSTQHKRPAVPFGQTELPTPDGQDWLDAWEARLAKKDKAVVPATSVVPVVPYLCKKALPYHPGGTSKLMAEVSHVIAKLKLVTKTEKSIMEQPRDLTVERIGFLQQAGLDNWDQFGRLSAQDVEDLCSHHPAAMAQAIIDLYHEAGLAEVAKMRDALKSGTDETVSV